MKIHIYIHHDDDGLVVQLLNKILKNQEKLLMTEQEALAAIQKVADITTRIGDNVGAEANTLQKISDEVDAILASNPGIPASVASRLQVLADATQAVSDNLDTHQAILTAILAKGQPVIPPTPVPSPTPVP